MQAPKKSVLTFIVRGALSLLLIGGLVYHIGSSAIIGQIQAMRWQIFALVVAILASHVLLVTPRWATILRGLGYPLSSFALVGSVYLGFLFNQVLPTAVGGDVLRAWRAQQIGVPWGVAIHSVLFDRASGLIVVLLGAFVLLPFADPNAVRSGLPWTIGSLAAGGLIAVAVIGTLGRMTVPLPMLGSVQRLCAEFLRSFADLSRRPWLLLLVGLLAAIGQLIPVAAIALLAKDLHIHVALIDIAVICFGAMLAAAIPISLAGWGLREGALVYLFGLYGVPAETALALSISFGACLVFASAPGILPLLAQGLIDRSKEKSADKRA